jgi:hypothetical protein
MAGSSFFALLDDIATLLDDISLMTKLAAKKTAGVLGDDLALNAQQVSGVTVNRELPVVWAVAKGSLRNKVILVPAALIVSAVAPWAIRPLLMLGGTYLCFEGAEKLIGPWFGGHQEDSRHAERVHALEDPATDMLAFERNKVRGAIRTDFVLSAEIVVIALGTVADASLTVRIAVLSAVALLMTVGVYGLVAGIVRLDDAGFYLRDKSSQAAKAVGTVLVNAAPRLMKLLSVLGTAAMFAVGGSIVAHGIAPVGHGIEQLAHALAVPGSGVVLPLLLQALFGVAVGAVVVAVVSVLRKLWDRFRARRS